ncbi:aspartate-semialdehyde dehydrogenase, partial [mine drainage metagenome]
MCLALKPLFDSFGVEKVIVTTMQALSGAGYPGVSSMDIVDNVIPFIYDEEEKVETEPLKIFGNFSKDKIGPASMAISAQCNRIAVKHGHTECVSVKLSRIATEKEVIHSFEDFTPNVALKLPSSPKHPVV